MKKFLPIGSVVLLKDSQKRIMIVGVKQCAGRDLCKETAGDDILCGGEMYGVCKYVGKGK